MQLLALTEIVLDVAIKQTNIESEDWTRRLLVSKSTYLLVLKHAPGLAKLPTPEAELAITLPLDLWVVKLSMAPTPTGRHCGISVQPVSSTYPLAERSEGRGMGTTGDSVARNVLRLGSVGEHKLRNCLS